MSLPIDLNGKQGIIGGDLNSWSQKLNANELELADGINELYDDVLEINGASTGLGLKQNITDNALQTTDKTIVGAINEHESDIVELNKKAKVYTFDTMADAQSASWLVTGDIIELLGYYEKGDGGGHRRKKNIYGSTYEFEVLHNNGEFCIEWFGAKEGSDFDSSLKIQECIEYVKSRVGNNYSGDLIGGATITTGLKTFKLENTIRINKSNIHVNFKMSTILLNFQNSSDIAIIVGTGEEWYQTGTISNCTKYNKIENFRITKAIGSSKSQLHILLSGTRSACIRNVYSEFALISLFLENTSELECTNFSSIGSHYSLIADSRKNRLSTETPLGISSIDNDVSSCNFNMFTSYYSQHTSALLVNTGTINFNSATIGIFSQNPNAGAPYGLPISYCGIHYYGSNVSYTKAGKMQSIVFEALPNEKRECIFLESNDKNNPIRGLSFEDCTVQTYAEDYTNNKFTTFMKGVTTGTGKIDNIVVRNSGFVYQDTGYYYGRLFDLTENIGIIADNVYPKVALSPSGIGNLLIRDKIVIERVNIETSRPDNVTPLGWEIASGVAGTDLTKIGGSSGNEAYLKFLNTVYIWKIFNFRNYLTNLNYVYIKFKFRGTTKLRLDIKVNGANETFRSDKSGTNLTRYSNSLLDITDFTTEWRTAFYCFKPFSANFGFDNVQFYLASSESNGTTYVEIKNIEIGIIEGYEAPYNVFA